MSQAQVIDAKQVSNLVEIRKMVKTMQISAQLIRNLGGTFHFQLGRPQIHGTDALEQILNTPLSEVLCVVKSEMPKLAEDDTVVTVTIRVANTGVDSLKVRAWLSAWDSDSITEFDEDKLTQIESGQIVDFTFTDFPRKSSSNWFTFVAHANPAVTLTFDFELPWKRDDVRQVSYLTPTSFSVSQGEKPEFRDPALTND